MTAPGDGLSSRQAEPDEASVRYRIGTVARLTGISVHALRAWERRYDMMEPGRSKGGERLYDDRDVERLRLVKSLIDSGHSIGELARLSTDVLGRIAEREGCLSVAPPAPASSASSDRTIERLLDAFRRLDIVEVDSLLSRAALMLGPRAFALRLVVPLLVRIGEAWAASRCEIFHEHAASAMLRGHLQGVLRGLTSHGHLGPVVGATLPGELHEFGALSASVLAATHGFRPVYLGPNLPADQIASAVDRCHARLVLISMIRPTQEDTLRELEGLRNHLAPEIPIVVGGAGLGDHPTPRNILQLPTLDALDSWLGADHPPAG